MNKPIDEICNILSKYEVKTRVILTGTLIVARDMAHGKIKEKLDSGLEMPEYFKNHPIVGKSTLTTNLALSLSNKNIKVGILDADIYGPSQPRMLGLKDMKPEQTANGKITTIDKYGIKCMSIGFLIDEDKPMVWRGPMVQGALEQLIITLIDTASSIT